MATTALLKPELINVLCTKRSALIDLMNQQVSLIKQSYALCSEMDMMIPSHPMANYDYLDIIFIQLKSAFGESSKYPLPKDVNLRTISAEQFEVIFTQILDKNLWQIVFNRLNIYSLMSSAAKANFNQQLKDSPLPFTVANVETTLTDLLSRQDELLINGLVDSIQSVDQRYVCNDRFKFDKKVIFKGVCTKQHGSFKLCDTGSFKDTIIFLSKVVFGNKTIRSNEKKINNTYLWGLVNSYFVKEQPTYLERDEVSFNGGRVVFFNNGNAHLILDDSVITFLNDSLGKTKGLTDVAS